jgi:hypothetical protein
MPFGGDNFGFLAKIAVAPIPPCPPAGVRSKWSTGGQIRTDFLERLGLIVLRFTNNGIVNLHEKVKQQIEN